MPTSFYLVEIPAAKMAGESFKISYGAIVAEIDVNKNLYCRYYYPLHLLSALTFSMILVIFTSQPMMQLGSISLLLNFPVSLLW